MAELIEPTTELYEAFRDCRADWGPGVHEDGFGLDERDRPDSPEGFARWVERMRGQLHPATQPCPETPHWSPRWIVEHGEILGAIALRHQNDDAFGRIGYGIRPHARRRGLATWALTQTLGEAHALLGLDRILLVCAEGNIASARTIERCGGAFAGIGPTELGPQRYYWIGLA